MKTYSPFSNSNALTISSSATGLPSFLQIFSYPIGLESFSCTKWKRSLCSCTALYRRTGTLTSPNEIDPDQIERGMLLVISAPGEGETLNEIDELFALPLDEFTAARNALAKRLTQDGDAETAEAVRALAKPTVAAWAVNQLARRDPEAVRSLLNVAARVRSAQERSLQGERAADELRAAQAEERDVIRQLTRGAEAVLRD